MKRCLKADWLEEFSYEESETILRDLAWSHVHESGRFRESLSKMLRDRDYMGLCTFELNYRWDDCPIALYHARQVLGFFSKYEPLKLGVDKEKVAFEKFLDAEIGCRTTNKFFRKLRSGEICISPELNAVMFTAQRKIAAILGDLPTWDQLKFAFGPGATTTLPRKFANWAVKLRGEFRCSTDLGGSLPAVLAQVPMWAIANSFGYSSTHADVDVKFDVGALKFVPKNARTYRGIIVEPVLNGFCQKGVGLHLRKRLQRFGVDLDDQSRNQRLANAGSRTGSLATVDLSSASDTISLELVYELLPLDWACFLAQFRTSKIQYKGVSFQLEKFSSMGNGFTFELESLIFYGLCWAVLEQLNLPKGWLAVYGDDIIIPSEAVPMLRKVLALCGFTVNEQKSFATGPFRESCGKDYFLGNDIRPYYQKNLVSGESLFVLHNFYMRQGDTYRALKVRRHIHPSLAIFGPDGYGDGHLIGSWGKRTPKEYACRGWEGTCFDTFQHRSPRLKRLKNSDCVLPVYTVYINGGMEDTVPYDPMVLPGSIGYRRVTIYTLRRGVFLA